MILLFTASATSSITNFSNVYLFLPQLKKLSYGNNRYIFGKLVIELVALAVKSSSVTDDRDKLCQYFLLMVLVLKQHYKAVSCLNYGPKK